VTPVHPANAWIGLAVLVGAAIAPSCIFWHPMRAYASGKEGRLRSLRHFRRVDRWLRIAGVAGGIALFRVDPLLLQWHHSVTWMYCGIAVSAAGVALLIAAKRALGWNYSPGFEAYVPFRIVNDGPYRFLRHPIYVGRLLIAGGACIMTGTAWLAIAWLVGLRWYWRAAVIEEVDLGRWFPMYHSYVQHTGRFFPRVIPRAQRRDADTLIRPRTPETRPQAGELISAADDASGAFRPARK